MNTYRQWKKEIIRCKYLGEQEVRDERNVIVGRFPTYSDPETMFVSVSYSHNKNSSYYHSKVTRELYGENLREDVVLNIPEDVDIDNSDVFFIDKEYTTDENGIPQYNFIVSGITKMHLFTLVSLAEVQTQ